MTKQRVYPLPRYAECKAVLRDDTTFVSGGTAFQRQGDHRPSEAGQHSASADLDRREHLGRAQARCKLWRRLVPVRAPAMLAQTARIAVMDSEALAEGIDDLRRRFDSAGRDFTGIDITFTNADGCSPGSDDFNADAYLTGLEKLAAVGVTWVQVGMPGDSLAHVLETIDRFGSSVIKAVS